MHFLALVLVGAAWVLAMLAAPAKGNFERDLEKFRSRVRKSPLPFLIVTSPFGPRRLRIGDHQFTYHNGVDYRAAVGTPVYAIADGTIEWGSPTPLECVRDGTWRWGYGISIAINHGVFTTLYSHLSAINPAMRPGRAVIAGEMIGFTGATGCVTGPHLHVGLGYNPHRAIPDDPFAGPADGSPNLRGRNPYWYDPERVLHGAAIT